MRGGLRARGESCGNYGFICCYDQFCHPPLSKGELVIGFIIDPPLGQPQLEDRDGQDNGEQHPGHG